MNTPLQFLRNWLPRGQRSETSHSTDSILQWLATLDAVAPQKAAEDLAERLVQVVSEQSNLHMRARFLEILEAAAYRFLPALEARISHATVPLVPRVQAVALAADNLLKALVQGCMTVVADAERRRLGSAPASLLQQVVQRAILAQQRQQILAYRVYAKPSAASWQQLHGLYHTARRHDIATLSRGNPSIERLYISTLLLAYANPAKYPRQEFDKLCACANRMSSLARLLDNANPKGRSATEHLFAIHTAHGESAGEMFPTSRTTSRASYFLDCGAIIGTLNRAIAQRRDPLPQHRPILPEVQETMLHTLRQMWSGQPIRRFSRNRFRPRADVVAGVADVIELISGNAHKRRRDDTPRPATPAGAAASPVSEWAIIDESPDGFGIHYLKGPLRRMEVGQLVGLRSREHNRVHICQVRRANVGEQARFELGLQDLSPNALVVPLPASASGLKHKAIFLPQMPAYDSTAGIIAAPGSLPKNVEFTYRPHGTPVRMRLGRVITVNNHLEFYLLEAVV